MRILFYILTSILLLSAAIPASAQKYLDVRQFNNTYEINIHRDGAKLESKCQAVRLSKEWFITAAHCLVPVCDSACTIKAKLANTKDYDLEMTTEHATTSRSAFLHSKSKEEQVSYDIALIKFAPEKTTYYFKDNKYFTLLTKEELFKKLTPSQKVEFSQAIDGINYPTILELKVATPKLLNRVIVVASVWDGVKNVLSSENYVFFSPRNNFLYTSNFGIRQGISGSGVITSTGELVGIVSAVAHMRRTLTVDGTAQETNIDFSMFSTFDDSVLTFLRRYIPDLNIKKAGFNYFAVVPDEYRSLVDNVEKL